MAEEKKVTVEELERGCFHNRMVQYAESCGVLMTFEMIGKTELLLSFIDGMYDKFSAFFNKRADEHQPPQTTKSHNIGESDYSEHQIQVWDIVDEYNLDFYEGNILKYLLRRKGKDSDHRNTNRFIDLQKLIHYAQRKMERLEK